MNTYGAYYMTVCIAALYKNGKGAVLIADRMTTYRVGPLKRDISLEERDTKKIYKANGLAIMFSGSKSLGETIIDNVKAVLWKSNNIDKAADLLVSSYWRIRREHALHKVILPSGFDGYDHYYREARANDVWYLKERELRDLPFEVSFLIVGKNRKGVVEIISVLGGAKDHIHDGKAAIGSGYPYTLLPLLTYRKNLSRTQTERILRMAKKEAEQSKDVGELTDVEYLP
jgi:hypothetical protein